MTTMALSSGLSDDTLARLYHEHGGEENLWRLCAQIYQDALGQQIGKENSYNATYDEMSTRLAISKGTAITLFYNLKQKYSP